MEGFERKEDMEIGEYNYVCIRRDFDQGLMSPLSICGLRHSSTVAGIKQISNGYAPQWLLSWGFDPRSRLDTRFTRGAGYPGLLCGEDQTRV